MTKEQKIRIIINIIIAGTYAFAWYKGYEWVVILLLTMQVNSIQEYLIKIYDRTNK